MSHRALKRFLPATSGSPAKYDAMTFMGLVRSGHDAGPLRCEWAAGKTFREPSGKSRHTCNVGVALEVVAGIPDFLAEAEFLLGALQGRLA